MKPFHNVANSFTAAQLRRNMKRKRKARGLSADLKSVIEEYRKISPEYANELERLLYPPLLP